MGFASRETRIDPWTSFVVKTEARELNHLKADEELSLEGDGVEGTVTTVVAVEMGEEAFGRGLEDSADRDPNQEVRGDQIEDEEEAGGAVDAVKFEGGAGEGAPELRGRWSLIFCGCPVVVLNDAKQASEERN